MKKALLCFSIITILIQIVIDKKIKQYKIQSNDTEVNFTLEIAQTPIELSNGLMWRTSLINDGMIFIYDHPQILYFWMKNTYLPLDIIFFDNNKKIIKIHHNAQPLSTEIISSVHKSSKVIELLGGTAKKYNLGIGDKLISN